MSLTPTAAGTWPDMTNELRRVTKLKPFTVLTAQIDRPYGAVTALKRFIHLRIALTAAKTEFKAH
jgi:hypothetical protein